MTDVLDDYHAWEAYPQYRWVLNKLDVSLRLGYHAGPAGVPVKHTGWYIVRPIYNPYGMGIGAHKKWLDADWQDGYKKQIEFYQWLLRGNGFKVSDTGYFVYCNGLKNKDVFDCFNDVEPWELCSIADMADHPLKLKSQDLLAWSIQQIKNKKKHRHKDTPQHRPTA